MTSRILALIEESQNGSQVKGCLEHCGYDVIVVNSFAQALILLKFEKIDLVISDVHLENGGNVFDFLKAVKNNHRLGGVPFVMFSFKPSPIAKYLADGVRTAMRCLGAIKYIEMETFAEAAFVEQIKSLLQSRQSVPFRQSVRDTRQERVLITGYR
jgi:DNA-binding NtrC family response regulator